MSQKIDELQRHRPAWLRHRDGRTFFHRENDSYSTGEQHDDDSDVLDTSLVSGILSNSIEDHGFDISSDPSPFSGGAGDFGGGGASASW